MHYCDMEPPSHLMASFRPRRDNQIMGLEMLSIAVGISSFAKLIAGRNIVVWSDNTAAEACTRKGTARSFDHLCIVHALWLRAAELHTELHIRRVPTEVNIADDPSREKYSLLDAIARKVPVCKTAAMLDEVFLHSQTWESLSVLGVF